MDIYINIYIDIIYISNIHFSVDGWHRWRNNSIV
jgi:hypothetical protein